MAELPEDFTFAAGHRIGIVIGANFSAYGSTNGMTQTDITLDTKLSKVTLPIVGGYDAAVAAGAFAAETVAPAIGPAPDITVDTAGQRARRSPTRRRPSPTTRTRRPEISCTPASGSTFTLGQTIVTCTAQDASGNTATKTFTVTVRGTQAVGGSVAGHARAHARHAGELRRVHAGRGQGVHGHHAPPTSSAPPATRRSASPTRAT